MSDIILKAENISKQYRLGLVGSRTFQDDLKRIWAKLRHKEDPFLKVGGVNDRSAEATQDYVWAIRNINFEVKRGEVLGIIGKNGAGKSTLLKILSRVTTPTTGIIKSRGRIASLLEVGTGFHPELTGKENIFLNGAILGMNKAEIRSKLDEIIDFSGCAMYIDTPVKRYSSGMRVRLAFAVAAHLEPEILVIDEVLAVGDAEFQKKAIGKMQDISKGEGRTVLFVSHNMASVKSLCTRAIVLENGEVIFGGSADAAVSYYLGGTSYAENSKTYTDFDNEYFSLQKISIKPRYGKPTAHLTEEDEIELVTELEFKVLPERYHLTYTLTDENGVKLFAFSHKRNNVLFIEGQNRLSCFFPKGFLNVGTYFLSFNLIEDSKRSVFFENDIFVFKVQEAPRELGTWMGREPGFIKPKFDWELNDNISKL